MDKSKISDAESELDMSRMNLSDEELKTVSGGFQAIESLRFYSWVCKTCGAEGTTFLVRDSAFSESMIAHKAATGHCEFTGLSALCTDSGGYGVNGTWTETV